MGLACALGFSTSDPLALVHLSGKHFTLMGRGCQYAGPGRGLQHQEGQRAVDRLEEI